MIARPDDTTREVGLRIGGILLVRARQRRRDRKESLGGQPRVLRLNLCPEAAVGSSGERPQLRRNRDSASMSEEGRSPASLLHSREHDLLWVCGELVKRKEEKGQRRQQRPIFGQEPRSKFVFQSLSSALSPLLTCQWTASLSLVCGLLGRWYDFFLGKSGNSPKEQTGDGMTL